MSEVNDSLDDPVPDPEAEAAAQEWAKNFPDKPLVINLSARIPDERLQKWLETDAQFHATWFRQRQDLEDQSQGSYDLALASFGLGAGLTEQEIVDLVVHHRAQHKQKQRSSLDYFQRLISKAASRTGGTDDLGKPTGPSPASAGPASSEDDHPSSAAPEADETAKKAAICKALSGVLGVQIHRIIKINGQSSIFYLEMAEGKARFPNVGKLISQTAVRSAIADITGQWMRRFNRKEWDKIAKALLAACTDKDGGEEMDMEGNSRLRLDQYLSARGFITSIEGQSPDNSRMPLVVKGSITVCASDIWAFINKTFAENITIPDVVGMLYAVGAESQRFRGKFKEQSRWFLPPDRFAPADYPHSVVEEPSDETH